MRNANAHHDRLSESIFFAECQIVFESFWVKAGMSVSIQYSHSFFSVVRTLGTRTTSS
jgi:hypothetical protein